jgi:hypothetical protein
MVRRQIASLLGARALGDAGLDRARIEEVVSSMADGRAKRRRLA